MLWVWWALNPLLIHMCIPLNLGLLNHTWCRGQFIDIFHDQPLLCGSQLHYKDTSLGQYHPSPLHLCIWVYTRGNYIHFSPFLYHAIPMHRNKYHVVPVHFIQYPYASNTIVYMPYVCRPMPMFISPPWPSIHPMLNTHHGFPLPYPPLHICFLCCLSHVGWNLWHAALFLQILFVH